METKRVYKGILASSSNPEELSKKVEGAIIASSSIIIFFIGKFLHIQLGANDIVSLASEIGGVVGAITIIYGSIRHIINLYGTKDVPIDVSTQPVV